MLIQFNSKRKGEEDDECGTVPEGNGTKDHGEEKETGATQEALAELSELTTQFVSYAEAGKRGMRPENLMKVAAALGVSTDFLLTGDIIDKDKLLLSDKLDKLTPQQVRIVENVIDECIALYSKDKQALGKTAGKMMGMGEKL